MKDDRVCVYLFPRCFATGFQAGCIFSSFGGFTCGLLQGLYVVSQWREKSVDGSAGGVGGELADDHTTPAFLPSFER